MGLHLCWYVKNVVEKNKKATVPKYLRLVNLRMCRFSSSCRLPLFLYKIGVYGYSYLEAGKAVMQLFSDRGWDAVVADDLVGNAIFLVSVIIGLIIGAFGISYASVSTSFDDLAQNSAMGAFFIGFIAGLFICSILLSTVASGVNTVIVMFADAPQEFQENHPELSQKMREVWQEFYPGSVQ